MAVMGTRPADVPDEAICIPPGATQTDTILSIQRSISKQNYNSVSWYAQGLYAWAYNAQVNNSLGIPVPPLPARPQIAKLVLEYASATGVPVKPGQAIGEDAYCWAWQTAEYLSLDQVKEAKARLETA